MEGLNFLLHFWTQPNSESSMLMLSFRRKYMNDSNKTLFCLFRCSQEDGQCHCLPNMIGRHCSDPAPGYFLPLLDYFLYEAEHAATLAQQRGSTPSSQVCDTYVLMTVRLCVLPVLVCSFTLFGYIFRQTQWFYHSVNSTSGTRVWTLSSRMDKFWFRGFNNSPASEDKHRWVCIWGGVA